LDAILSEHRIVAQDAYWDTKTYKVVEAQKGLGFNTESVAQMLNDAQQGSTVTIPFVLTDPEITTEELNKRMFGDTLSTFTAESSSNSGRKNNLKLACQAVNGIILNPGETFDYNTTLGKRTSERGYKPANAYVNGETVQTIGGGICQVSSTIYYCALMADLEIVTRRNHSYPSSYIPLGMDATVSWGGPEFKFRNNTDYPIKIVATASGGDTTVSLMSYDDRDYYVKMEYEVLKKTSYSVVYKTFPADNPEGYKNGDVISTPYTGYVVNTYRVKYSKETNQEISRTFEAKSTYKHRDKVIAKVEAAAPSTPTEPATPSHPSGSDILDQIR
jgi:vancomycin resistance protein YoaR